MDIFASIIKHTKTVKLQKMPLYKSLEAYKDEIIKNGFEMPNTILELYFMEVAKNGLVAYQNIINAYTLFVRENQEIINHMNYDERRKILQHDIQQSLLNSPCFVDDEVSIYVPFFESFINQRMYTDYEMFELKQHQNYIKGYKKSYKNIIEMYKLQPLISGFSSLRYIRSIQSKSIFYDQTIQSLIIIDTNNFDFRIVSMQDSKKESATLNQAIEIVDLYCENKTNDIIEFFLVNNLFAEKTIKKINKDLGNK